ncbi:hypothetical protein DIPPA_63137 [Diplonema papillatum]|nr:hypothetical protein DIPPA_63137 [Diplonema papillatum]
MTTEEPLLKHAIRHAEKRRIASCTKADDIAHCVVHKYKSLLAARKEQVPDGEMPPKQTVIAGIVLIVEANCPYASEAASTFGPGKTSDDKLCSFYCLSLGQGTKFLSPTVLAEADGNSHRVRDAHAEVLARRGFKKWYIVHKTLYWKMVNAGAELAFYTSTAPCGNSCLKKWAKNTGTPDSLPHPAFNVSARAAGQVAVTVKGDFHDNEDDVEPSVDGIQKWVRTGISAPVGMTPAAAVPLDHRIASCSDKIASWMVLGMQGATSDPPANWVFPKYFVCGRKYGNTTLRRALCCRLEHTKKNNDIQVQHPLILCTGMILDDSTYNVDNDEKASFASNLCLLWMAGEKTLEAINGTTGLTYCGTSPSVSRASLSLLWYGLEHEAANKDSSDTALNSYMTAKAKAELYAMAKKSLFGNRRLLYPFPRHQPDESESRPCKRPRSTSLNEAH